MNALSIVFWYELKRTVSKKSFWIRTLAIPLMIAAVLVLSFFSQKVSNEAENQLKQSKFSLQVLDDSGLVDDKIMAALGAKLADSRAAGMADVKAGLVDAFIYYPAEPNDQAAEVYAQDAGLMDNGKYTAVASQLLQASLAAQLGSTSEVELLQNGVATKLTTFEKGQATKGFGRIVAPGLFLVLFYIVIVLLGNQMLTSTTEEKENRVVEMILTCVSAADLIWGKIWALVAMGIIQIAAILAPIAVAYLGFREKLQLPSINFDQISFTPWPILAGLALFVGGFVIFTALLVTIGSAVPTAKEASGYFGGVIIMMFLPFYALAAIATSPHQLVVQVLTYFPLTAPITLMIRNAVGNASAAELTIGISVTFIGAALLMALAVKIFRYGSLEYARKLSWREIFARRI